MAIGKEIEKLVVTLEAGHAAFKKDLDKAARDAKSGGSSIGKAVATGFTVGAAAVTAFSVASLKAYSSAEKLTNQLASSLKYIEGTSLQFAALDRYAANTPSTIDDVVNAFTKLKNLGLDPSEAALTSYSNTSLAMAKSLDQLIEAVADASVGEFERLKEFGIKAKSEGDNVTFTFQGISTTVEKSSDAIQQYLQNIGSTTFAGTLERQGNTVEAVFTNLGDATERLLTKMAGDSGLVDATKSVGKALADLFNQLAGLPREASVISADIDRINKAIDSAVDERTRRSLAKRMSELRDELTLSRSISNDASDVQFAIDEVDQQLERYKATLSRFSDEQRALYDKAIESGDSVQVQTKRGKRSDPLFEQYKGTNEQLKVLIQERGALVARLKEIGDGGETGISEKQKRAAAELLASLQTPQEKYKALVAEITELEGVGAITKETYNRALAQYKVELDDATGKTDRYKEALATINSSLPEGEQQLQRIAEQQRFLNQTIAEFPELAGQASEALRRLEEEKQSIILEENGSFWQKYLESAKENLTSLDELTAQTINNFSSGIGDAFEEMVFDSENFGDAIYKLADGMARSIVNALGKMAAEWLAYKAVQMLVGKSTAASSVDTLTANAQAASLMAGINAFSSTAAIPIVGPPAAPAAMGAAIAATQPMAAAVAALSASTLASFDGGGYTGSGTRTGGLDGRGGFMAMLHPQETVLDHTKGQGMGGMVVNVHNYSGQQVETQQNGNQLEVFIGRAKQSIAADITSGRGVGKTMQDTFGLKRAGRV